MNLENVGGLIDAIMGRDARLATHKQFINFVSLFSFVYICSGTELHVEESIGRLSNSVKLRQQFKNTFTNTKKMNKD
jgi:hypothetical protein